jgi:hypothetical protein
MTVWTTAVETYSSVEVEKELLSEVTAVIEITDFWR